MCIGQEVHNTIIFRYRHTLAIGDHRSIKLAVGQDDTFRVACSSTGIEDIGDIVERCLLLQLLHLNLTWQALTQFQKVAEVNGVGINLRKMNQGIEHNNAFKRRTERKDATGLVILVLFTNKEEAYLGIVDHKLYLLLGTGGIERNGHSTNAPSTKITLNILH